MPRQARMCGRGLWPDAGNIAGTLHFTWYTGPLPPFRVGAELPKAGQRPTRHAGVRAAALG